MGLGFWGFGVEGLRIGLGFQGFCSAPGFNIAEFDVQVLTLHI